MKESRAVDAVRLGLYQRVSGESAGGFAVTVERMLPGRLGRALARIEPADAPCARSVRGSSVVHRRAGSQSTMKTVAPGAVDDRCASAPSAT